MIERLPRNVGPPDGEDDARLEPGWVLLLLIGLLTVEWVWRRRVGLA